MHEQPVLKGLFIKYFVPAFWASGSSIGVCSSLRLSIYLYDFEIDTVIAFPKQPACLAQAFLPSYLGENNQNNFLVFFLHFIMYIKVEKI